MCVDACAYACLLIRTNLRWEEASVCRSLTRAVHLFLSLPPLSNLPSLFLSKGAGSIEELLSKLNTRMDRMEMDMFAAPGPAPLKPESISLRQSHERQNQQLQTVTPTAITTLLEEIRVS